MSRNFIWLHEDALRHSYPVFKAAGEGAEAIFIWDEAYFQQEAYSLKRLTFIYECLMELPVSLYKGDTLEVLSAMLNKDNTLFIPETPNPYFKQISESLSEQCEVRVIANESFVIVPDDVDLKRFFRFWNKAKKSALTPSHSEAE